MSDERPSRLPAPRNARLPFLLVSLVVVLVTAVVMMANGGRNMTAILKALDLPLPQFLQSLETVDAPKARTVPGRRRDWPWFPIITPTDSLVRMPLPEENCRSLALADQETPSFSRSADDGWECSTLVQPDGEGSGSSLFLHARGAADNQFSVVRVKFNLADGPMASDIALGAIGFINTTMALPPSDDRDADLARKLADRADFYFVAGYHPLTFKRELDDPDRYNLIGFNRRSTGSILITQWPKIIKAGELSGVVVAKGPRIGSRSR